MMKGIFILTLFVTFSLINSQVPLQNPAVCAHQILSMLPFFSRMNIGADSYDTVYIAEQLADLSAKFSNLETACNITLKSSSENIESEETSCIDNAASMSSLALPLINRPGNLESDIQVFKEIASLFPDTKATCQKYIDIWKGEYDGFDDGDDYNEEEEDDENPNFIPPRTEDSFSFIEEEQEEDEDIWEDVDRPFSSTDWSWDDGIPEDDLFFQGEDYTK